MSKQRRPDASLVAKRLAILKFVVAHAMVAPPRSMLKQWMESWPTHEVAEFKVDAMFKNEEFWQRVRDVGLWDLLSPDELALANSDLVTMTLQQQVNASWRLEAAQVLMWALELIPGLPPYDTQASNDLLRNIPKLPELLGEAKLRDESTIDKARDLAELWHWRSRTRQLIEAGDVFRGGPKAEAAGMRTYDDIVRVTSRIAAENNEISQPIDEDFPAKGKAYRDLTDNEWNEVRSITVERHFALNWLCGHAPGNAWDETPTDT
jgi:hypothetical protein